MKNRINEKTVNGKNIDRKATIVATGLIVPMMMSSAYASVNDTKEKRVENTKAIEIEMPALSTESTNELEKVLKETTSKAVNDLEKAAEKFNKLEKAEQLFKGKELTIETSVKKDNKDRKEIEYEVFKDVFKGDDIEVDSIYEGYTNTGEKYLTNINVTYKGKSTVRFETYNSMDFVNNLMEGTKAMNTPYLQGALRQETKEKDGILLMEKYFKILNLDLINKDNLTKKDQKTLKQLKRDGVTAIYRTSGITGYCGIQVVKNGELIPIETLSRSFFLDEMENKKVKSLFYSHR